MSNDHWFDPQVWARITDPTAKGSALPNAAYTDSKFFDLEQNSLFKKKKTTFENESFNRLKNTISKI